MIIQMQQDDGALLTAPLAGTRSRSSSLASSGRSSGEDQGSTLDLASLTFIRAQGSHSNPGSPVLSPRETLKSSSSNLTPPVIAAPMEAKPQSRKKTVRRKVNRGSKLLASSTSVGLSEQSSGSLSGESDIDSPAVEDIFSSLHEQLHKAQAALQAREAQVQLRAGRLRAKKRALIKKESASSAKLEAVRVALDAREADLVAREQAYEARMRRMTRLKKDERMTALIDEFSANPEIGVIPLQRAIRGLLCRRSLRNACKLVLTAESFRDSRRRNAALMEIFSSEAEHVNRLQQLYTFRKLAEEHFASGTLKAVSPVSLKKVFVGLDEALDAAKVLLSKLNVCKQQWPGHTGIVDVFTDWVNRYLPMYKTSINHYDAAVASLKQLRSKKAFVEWETNIQGRNLPIDSLLIVPIQRLPRYRMLLEALDQLTEECHVDKQGLKQLLELVRCAVLDVNKGKGVVEKMQVLLDLDQVISNSELSPIVIPDRMLIHRGSLGDALDTRAPVKHYVLFNDSLFELQPRIAKRTLLFAGSASKKPQEYDFVRSFPLDPAQPLELREIPPSVLSNGFSLRSEGWSLDLFASSAQELRAWILAIKGMRRLERKALSCENCAATVIHGADRCHVCHRVIIE